MIDRKHYEALYYVDKQSGTRISGPNPNLSGDCSSIWGDCTGVWGNFSGLSGDVTGLVGDGSFLSGDIDYARVVDAPWRVNIEMMTKLVRKYQTS